MDWIMVYPVIHVFSMGCATEHSMVNYGWIHSFLRGLSFSFLSLLVVAQIRGHTLHGRPSSLLPTLHVV